MTQNGIEIFFLHQPKPINPIANAVLLRFFNSHQKSLFAAGLMHLDCPVVSPVERETVGGGRDGCVDGEDGVARRRFVGIQRADATGTASPVGASQACFSSSAAAAVAAVAAAVVAGVELVAAAGVVVAAFGSRQGEDR